jgi:N-acetylmuramoyl-L-alanine amidase
MGALLFAAAMAGASHAAMAAQIESVRFGHENGKTRIVLEADYPVDFRVQAIDSPPRLVLDLPEVAWRVRADPLGQPRGMATGHRYGKFAPGRSRLVVDITEPFEVVDEFVLPPRDGERTFRIVVDIAPVAVMPAPGTPDGPTLAALTPPQQPAAPLRPSLRPDPTVAEKPIIVIDPGHGGLDPGARSILGADEKEVTLAMSQVLREQLLATGRYQVAMTRTDDRYVALGDRIAIARRAEGDLFLSIHADSIADRSIRGASVYTVSDTASDAEAARLAASENRADILAGADLSYQDPLVASILIDISRRDATNRSIQFADGLVDELGDVTPLLRNTRRFAGFVVLKSPDTPSVLVELGYLSHPTDAKMLMQPAHRTRLAEAIVRAVDRHFGHLK